VKISGHAARAAALVLLAAASPAAAANPETVTFGTFPVAPAVASLEFPVGGSGLSAEIGAAVLGQGTFTDQNPFAYLSAAAPYAWLHFDGVQNLRLSLAYQEFFYFAVPPLGIPDGQEERLTVRARLQQPRGTAALYEMVQLDVRWLDDSAGNPAVVYRPRLRIGQGFNLDAVRIHSLVLYQEVALRFSPGGHVARNFDFFRAFLGYGWTTRRGTYVTLGIVGQLQLNPAATAYTVIWGPVLGVQYRIRAAPPAEAPPPLPPDVDVQ
jgi:hypothetical protein